MNLREVLKASERFAVNNSPAILSGIAVAGTVATAYLTGKATFKAAEVLAMNESITVPLTNRERVELTWKLYIPAATTGLLTVASIIAATQIGIRRTAAVAAAYSLMEKGFDEYKEKMKEKLGPKKEQAARDEIAQARVDGNPASSQIIIVGRGDVLCYEIFTGRYFRSDMESLRKAANDINHQVNNDFYASLTDFYDILGLPSTGISDDVGWNAGEQLELAFSAVIGEDSVPAIAFNYSISPIRGYNRLQ